METAIDALDSRSNHSNKGRGEVDKDGSTAKGGTEVVRRANSLGLSLLWSAGWTCVSDGSGLDGSWVRNKREDWLATGASTLRALEGASAARAVGCWTTGEGRCVCTVGSWAGFQEKRGGRALST